MFTVLAAGGASGSGRATLLMNPATFVTAVMPMAYVFRVFRVFLPCVTLL
jgi:hypothetical protein